MAMIDEIVAEIPTGLILRRNGAVDRFKPPFAAERDRDRSLPVFDRISGEVEGIILLAESLQAVRLVEDVIDALLERRRALQATIHADARQGHAAIGRSRQRRAANDLPCRNPGGVTRRGEDRVRGKGEPCRVPGFQQLLALIGNADLAMNVPFPVGAEEAETAVAAGGKMLHLAAVAVAHCREVRICRALREGGQVVGGQLGLDALRKEGIVCLDGDAADLGRRRVETVALVAAYRRLDIDLDIGRDEIAVAGIDVLADLARRKRLSVPL